MICKRNFIRIIGGSTSQVILKMLFVFIVTVFWLYSTAISQACERMMGVNISDAMNADTYSPEQLASQITSSSNTVHRIGFIGLGAMGFGMAAHLLKSKFSVLGYDVNSILNNLLDFSNYLNEIV